MRDLPWPPEKLRVIPFSPTHRPTYSLRLPPPFEFENWAVIALGGIKNKTQVGDMGIDGRIFPVSALDNRRKNKVGELDLEEKFSPSR